MDHSSDPHDPRIFVKLSIVKKEGARIRTDTIARVTNKGLLGDRMIELSVGSPDAPMLPPDQLIASEEPADMFAAANRLAAAGAGGHRRSSSRWPRRWAIPSSPPTSRARPRTFTRCSTRWCTAIGTMHRIFYDHGEADQLDTLLGTLQRTSTHLDATRAPRCPSLPT